MKTFPKCITDQYIMVFRADVCIFISLLYPRSLKGLSSLSQIFSSSVSSSLRLKSGLGLILTVSLFDLIFLAPGFFYWITLIKLFSYIS
jgi:hypothetical protein